MKYLLLTIDLEEFDLPEEYGIKVSDKDKFEISFKGTKKILKLLNKNDINATFFVTASFAKKYPKLIKKISKKNEIGLHAYEHNHNYGDMKDKVAEEFLRKAKKEIENIIGKKIFSFRAPRFQPPKYEVLKNIGIKFDSSLNPTWIPGRYNNLLKSRNIFEREGIKIIPLSTTPLLRFPLFWISFRNLNLFLIKFLSKICLFNQNFLNLVFHPWEFMDLKKIDKNKKLSLLIKRNSGKNLENKLRNYLSWVISKNISVVSIEEYLKKI
jgi:hypothetical protein